MKSFFKKLAFVMALAMVVSMIAPAGSALAATTGVSLQGTKNIVETYELDKVGATVDFSFQGAPADWKSTFKWTSSNEAVATVDKAGIVTAVAAGTATITITAGADASYVETVVVTVKGASAAFEVAQADLTHFTMTFDAKKDVKAEDIAVVLMINDVEAPIPVKDVAVNENVATVELFSEFIDGITYKVTYGEVAQTFEGSIGAIEKVAFSYYTAKKGDNVAYVSTDDEPSITKLVYALYDANGVDVTSAYDEEALNIEYAVVNESEDFEVIDNELSFYKAGAAVIEIKVSWTDDEGETIERTGTGVVVATKRPALAHSLVEAGFIGEGWYLDDAMNVFTTDADSVFWTANKYSTSWVLGDEGKFQFAAVVKDNRGNTVVTGLNQKGNYAVDEETGEQIYPYGYFKFVTSNDEIVDIDDEGAISFWGAGSASVITYFVDTTGDEEREVFVGSTKITVSPARYVASASFASTSAAVAVKDANLYGHNNLATFVLTAFDQYGKNIALNGGVDAITIKKTVDDVVIPSTWILETSESCTKPWDEQKDCTGWWCGNSQGGFHYHISFQGDDFAEFLGTKTSRTAQYAVSIDKDLNDTLKSGTTATLKLTVKDTVDYADALLGGTAKNYYYGITGGGSVDLAVSYKKDYSRTYAEDAVKVKKVEMKNLSSANGFEMVGVANVVELTEGQKTGAAGTLYFEVEAPKKVQNFTYNVGEWGQEVVLNWNTADGTNFGYATTGTYKVIVKAVKNTNIGKDGTGVLSTIGTYVYNVTNSQADPKFTGYNAKLGNKSNKDLEVYTDTVIKENLVFTLDGKVIDWEEAGYTLELTDVVVTAKKIRVNEVTITVPVDDNNSATNYSYTKKVKVGKTIYFEEEE